MAYTDVTSVRADVQIPPIVAELAGVFSRLDDAPLLDALTGPTRRGPKGYPVAVLWRCYVTKYVLGLASTAALLRLLRDNPFVARACGIKSPDSIPHEATLSRFFGRLAHRDVLPRLKDVSRSLVRECYASVPGFGKRVAMDSTTVKGWVNGAKNVKVDPEAGWSVKQDTQGRNSSTFGWKLHLLVDCESELPIAANVTAGNVHDSQRATHLLSEARFTHSTFRPDYVMADKGYSGRHLFREIHNQYHATPIIQVNTSHKKLLAKSAPTEVLPGWKALYRQRTAIERVNSRLKGQHSLNRITVRRRMKVTAHCYLSLIALQVKQVQSTLVQPPIPQFARLAGL